MSSRPWKPMVVGLVLVAAAWAAAAGVQAAIDRERKQYPEAPALLWIPSGKVMRKLSFGHEGLLAHIYWTRVVQYYGGQLRDQKTDFRLLAPLLDITVTLDPHLLVAYKFGGLFLSAPPPRGANQPREAVHLLERGIQANPEEWRLWHELGFIYYWELHEYNKASAAYLEGAKNPAAAPWMKVMSAVIAEKGGNRETSRFLWTEIHQSAEDELIRENARGHLETLRALDDLDEMKRRAGLFRQQTGRWPQSFQEMISQGLLIGIPTDPQGFPYQLQPNGEFTLHADSKVQLERGPSPR